MKKTIALAAAFALLFSLPAFAQAEELLQGVIMEASAGQFTMYDETYGEVVAHYGDDTPMEGLAAPAAGQYVAVTFSGIMTRSLPPQVTAERIERFTLDGVALAYDPKVHAQLILSPDAGLVLARLPETAEPYAPGDFVTVSYNGLTDQPAPGRVNAWQVTRLESTQGVITDTGDGWFLIGEGDAAVRVNIDGNTRLHGALSVGETAVAYHSAVMTLSLPPQVYGEVVIALDLSR